MQKEIGAMLRIFVTQCGLFCSKVNQMIMLLTADQQVSVQRFYKYVS